jgi:hypothetical protein
MLGISLHLSISKSWIRILGMYNLLPEQRTMPEGLLLDKVCQACNWDIGVSSNPVFLLLHCLLILALYLRAWYCQSKCCLEPTVLS